MTARTRPWWHEVVTRSSAADEPARSADAATPVGAPEPWGDQPITVAPLTTAQQAVLAGLDDQPHGPRLDGVVADMATPALGEDQPRSPRLRPGAGPGNGTGSAPGDADPIDPHTRTRWTEQEQPEL